jgi:4-hydroxy-tetrahydrodipicolinate synthase
VEFTHLAEKLADVVAIPVTPFDDEGAVDTDTYGRLIRRIVDAGVRVVTPNGNTGEFYALTAEEARHVTVAAVRAAGTNAEVLVGVGRDVPGAVEAAQHARSAGASMVMVHQPVHPYVSAEGWIDYHRQIAEAVPELGVVLYVRDARITGAQLHRLGELCPNVIGVKYAVPDSVRFASVARDAGLDRFTWIAGLAEPYAPGYFAAGARGFTSGLVNVHPRISLHLLDVLRAGDFPAAMATWERIRRFEELRSAQNSANNVSVVKEALAQLGLCSRAVRPPSHLLSEAERDEVAKVLAAWGLPE